MMHNKVSTTASLTLYCGMTYRIYPASIEKFNNNCGSLLRLILKLRQCISIFSVMLYFKSICIFTE